MPVALRPQLPQIELMDDWMKSSVMNNQVGFLMADLDTALAFMNVGETTHNDETRKRNFRNARHAYDTVLQLMQKVTLDDVQNEALQKRLALLRTRLEAVGQKF